MKFNVKLPFTRSLVTSCLALGFAAAGGANVAAQAGAQVEPPHAEHAPQSPPPRRTTPWDPEILRLAETLPIQEQGRVKPLSTFAAFKLLQLNGVRTLEVEPGQGVISPNGDKTAKLTPIEWLLDCLYFPEQAQTYLCFQLQTSDVADAIGIGHEGKKKRDRYSYMEIAPGRKRLKELADRIAHDPKTKDAKNRTATEEQLVQLATKVGEFDRLCYFGEFARDAYPLPADGNLGPYFFDGASEIRFDDMLKKGPLLVAALRELMNADSTVEESQREPKKKAIESLLGMGQYMGQSTVGLSLLPPQSSAKESPEWLTVYEVFDKRLRTEEPIEPLIPAVGALEDTFRARGDMGAIKSGLDRFRAATTELATRRGEGLMVESEVAFYKADLFFYAQWLYVLGFVLIAAGWLTRADARIHRFVPYALMIPLALHIAGIVWRCILRSRPPVSTLYETILFISCIAVLAAIVVEMIDKRRIAIAFAAAIGAFGLFFSASYEAKDAYDNGVDTMPQLQAVLDTNYWLSTHVTTVTIGYSAGLLAGLLAHVYVIGKLFGLKKNEPGFYRSVARMVYGVICFGLLFSVVGTILGGVWANDSWGRFWGWDPKENGALMICLWELAILHARMGGYIKDLGVCIAAIFGGTIVAFSWWHVNLLGVGLHSYGFTHGLLGKVWTYYFIEWLFVLAGLYLLLEERARRKVLAANAAAAAAASNASKGRGQRGPQELPGSAT